MRTSSVKVVPGSDEKRSKTGKQACQQGLLSFGNQTERLHHRSDKESRWHTIYLV